MDYRVSRKALTATGENQTFAVLEAVLERASPVFHGTSENELARLTPGQRMALAVQYFEMEVNSGGLDSYFRYTGGDTAAEALAGLRTIGATRFAEILEKAMALFPRGRPAKDTDERADQLDRIEETHPDALGDLDGQFYDAYGGEESLGNALIAYMRAEPKQFFVD